MRIHLSSHFTTWQCAWQATAPQLAGGLNKCPRGEQPCWLFLCLPFQHLIIDPQKKNLTRKPRTPFPSQWPRLLLGFLSSFIFWRLSTSPVWRSLVGTVSTKIVGFSSPVWLGVGFMLSALSVSAWGWLSARGFHILCYYFLLN